MALSIIEEVKILKGRIRPEVITLEELISQSSTGASVNFYNDVKVFDAGINPLASIYKDKMINLVTSILDRSDVFVEKLKKVIVSLLGNTTVTSTQLVAATDEQWVTFVENNMLQAMELLANVLPEEKTEYDSIV